MLDANKKRKLELAKKQSMYFILGILIGTAIGVVLGHDLSMTGVVGVVEALIGFFGAGVAGMFFSIMMIGVRYKNKFPAKTNQEP